MRGRRRGHSLLEMVMAAFLFATVAVGISSLWLRASKSMGASSSRLVAQHLGQQLMETCIAARYSGVPALVGSQDISMSETVRGTPKLTIYRTVVSYRDQGDLRIVTVSVEWRQGFGYNQIDYKTMLCPNG